MPESALFPPPSPVPSPPPEPKALRDEGTELALDNGRSTRQMLARGEWLADYLWAEWEAELGAAGVTRALLVEELGRWAREIWLWLLGERQWTEVAGLIYGGVLRRATRS